MSWSRKQWVINSSRLMTLAGDIDYIINNERHLHCFSQDNIYRLQRRYRFFIGYRKKCWKDWSLVVQSPNSKISEYCFVRWDGCVWRLPWPYTFSETLGAQLSLKWLFNWNLITERQELITNDGWYFDCWAESSIVFQRKQSWQPIPRSLIWESYTCKLGDQTKLHRNTERDKFTRAKFVAERRRSPIHSEKISEKLMTNSNKVLDCVQRWRKSQSKL